MPEHIIHKHTHSPRGLPCPTGRALPLLAEGGRRMQAGSTLDDRSSSGCDNRRRRRGFGAEAPAQARAVRAAGPGGREMRPRIASMADPVPEHQDYLSRTRVLSPSQGREGATAAQCTHKT
ncbi:hypothetical protein MTO96_015516 [Rhipicephalus appendiculatus]